MQYQAYFWDFDGTLYDTYPVMVRAFGEALRQANIKVDLQEAYTIMRQASLSTAFAHYVNPEQLAALKVQYQKLEASLADEVKPFKGAKEICQKIVAQGGQNFLLTHRDQSALAFLKRDGLLPLFTDFVTSKQHFARKPDPASLNYLLQKHQVSLTQAVMVGDRQLDVLAGQNAQIASVLFDPDNLIQATDWQPDIRIELLTDLK